MDAHITHTCIDQKTAVDPLKLELPTFSCHHVGAEKQIWILFKSSRCSHLLSRHSSHSVQHLFIQIIHKPFPKEYTEKSDAKLIL